MPGRFYQDAAQVSVARLGDRPLPPFGSAAGLAGNKPGGTHRCRHPSQDFQPTDLLDLRRLVVESLFRQPIGFLNLLDLFGDRP